MENLKLVGVCRGLVTRSAATESSTALSQAVLLPVAGIGRTKVDLRRWCAQPTISSQSQRTVQAFQKFTN